VAGLAGVGKSSLAAEVVRQLVADSQAFPGGIAYVFCGGQEQEAGLLWVYDRLLDAWGATIDPAALARAQDLASAVAVRERALRERLRPSGEVPPTAALVLLDNVEEAFPLAQALSLLGALGVTVLTTSRHRPDVPGLALLRIDVLEAGPALALMAARYREAGGDWQEARDSGPAGQCVALLGDLPLAIELAASYAALDGISLANLAAELSEHSRLGPLSLALSPQGGVRYAFSQTCARLDAWAQRVFAMLGLPAGADWPREVIEGMLHGMLWQEDSALSPSAALTALAARSLVSLATEPGASGEQMPRVRMHPLLREYAGERYAALPPDQQNAALAALMEAVAAFAATHHAGTAAEFAVLRREEALLADTIRRASAAQVAAHACIAAVTELNNYLLVGGHWQLGTELRLLQLTALRRVGDRPAEGRILTNLGILADNQGRPTEAARYYEQALLIEREVGDRAGEEATRWRIRNLEERRGQRDAVPVHRIPGLLGGVVSNIGTPAMNRERAVGPKGSPQTPDTPAGPGEKADAERLQPVDAPLSPHLLSGWLGPIDAPSYLSGGVGPADAPLPDAAPLKPRRRWWPFGR
jgi:tetratricopeptide (TPR) repeat protein